ncbi:hypothetical protein O181_042821 [Austropuccinia psidii MF-1]|uniref:Uncharacterized protein n=1 Tax=Austropuccinia psidii MF-1 TaxID=1389203 RepID=A0A9Q3DMC0_9BASI|nr:hypothetical protein [Austropuccinia psidii MF-1]
MPSTRSGASYNPSSSSQKGHRIDCGRSQSVAEGKTTIYDSKSNKVIHSESNNTVLPSNRADTATRSLSGYIQSQPEGLQQLIAAQRVPDPCRSWEKLHEFLRDCEKIPGPSQHFQVTPWIASIDGKEKHDALKAEWRKINPPPPIQVPKTSPVASSRNSNVKKQPQAQDKGKSKAPATKPYSQVYRIPKIQKDAMENLFQMGRKMMELQKKEEARLKYHKLFLIFLILSQNCMKL